MWQLRFATADQKCLSQWFSMVLQDEFSLVNIVPACLLKALIHEVNGWTSVRPSVRVYRPSFCCISCTADSSHPLLATFRLIQHVELVAETVSKKKRCDWLSPFGNAILFLSVTKFFNSEVFLNPSSQHLRFQHREPVSCHQSADSPYFSTTLLPSSSKTKRRVAKLE